MTVPEAAVHETHGSEPTEDQVRRPPELPIMKTVPEAARMQRAAKGQLGFRVPGADSCHHARPDRSINYVGHELACIAREERDRACISQNVVEAIKEDGVIVRRIARAEFGHPKAPGKVPDCRLMDQSQRRAPISQFATGGSRLRGDPPGKQITTCRPVVDQP